MILLFFFCFFVKESLPRVLDRYEYKYLGLQMIKRMYVYFADLIIPRNITNIKFLFIYVFIYIGIIVYEYLYINLKEVR